MKLQILPHIMDDIRRHGPAIGKSTEIFECFNAIFRMCSVLSNHQAPSRDIGTKFASMDRVKHILSGGYWKDGETWVQAGPKVRDVLLSHSVVQRHLGWTSPLEQKLGACFQFLLTSCALTTLLSRPCSLGDSRKDTSFDMARDPCICGAVGTSHHFSSVGPPTFTYFDLAGWRQCCGTIG